ncbi:uncharacterized protein BXZ73DRAFT_56696 [Epithele typhae]|uniref:uncharacterized protein n=1 Tax=Epithele typhae TaxID=378194 RepID=UPI0020087449|nr:uncharacterized protein BXZ73DRAFT_56696 [Epithele typhae]KAH9911955.1 hypothetical protein BXZ73DRAFT_56696 [Epithele typhae]
MPSPSRAAVSQWEADLEAWQDDPTSAPDPYEEPRPTVTLKAVRLQIAEEEAIERRNGSLPPHEVSPGVFLQVGLDLEEQQRALQAMKAKMSTGENSRAAVQEKRNTLQHCILLWQAMQGIHMPITALLRNLPDLPNGPTLRSSPTLPAVSTTSPSLPSLPTLAEDIPLLLPSAIPSELRLAHLSPSLLDKALKLRLAQADDALDDIRRYRRIITGVREFTRLNISGTGQRTTGRARSVYSAFQDKINHAAERYRAARHALLSLDPQGEWQTRFKDLQREDIRGPGRPDDNNQTGDGRYEISWIWLVPRVSGDIADGCQDLDPTELLNNMRHEWATSKARADRWREEVELLEEEMGRILEFFEWKARWWRDQTGRRVPKCHTLASGLAAYAEKQASVFEGLAVRCATLWLPHLRARPGYSLPTWSTRYAEYATSEVIEDTTALLVMGEETTSESSGDESDST